MTKTRRKFTPQFKGKVVLEILKADETLSQIASKYDISPNVIKRWQNEFLAHPDRVFSEKEQCKAQKRKEDIIAAEKDEMLKTIGNLIIERDYLRRCCKKFGIEKEAHYTG